MRFFVIFCCTCILTAMSMNTQAQSIENQQLKLKKVDHQNNELAFTVLDAVELIRFLMTKNDVIKDCKSDFSEGTLRVIGHEEEGLGILLLDENFNDELLAMGYRIYSDEDVNVEPYPLMSVATEVKDCDTCGNAEVSQDAIDSVLEKANYDGEIMFDFGSDAFGGMSSSDGGGDDFMMGSSDNSTLNLDSISNIINSEIPLDLEVIDDLAEDKE